MYLFSRRARLAPGNTRAAMTWVADITEKARQITGQDITAFTSIFSPQVGTIVWSLAAPDLAALETANDKLLTDDGYTVLVDEGARLVEGGVDDSVLNVLHGEMRPDRVVEYAGIIQTACTAGNLARGIEVGVEIAKRAEQATGIPSMFATTMNGAYGSVMWMGGYVDIDEMERAQTAMWSDASFVQFVDDNVKGVYVEDPAISQQLTYRRVA